MDLNAHVKSVIEGTACKYHNKNPQLEFINGQIEVTCCCPDFKVICLKKLIRVLIEYKDEPLQIAWRKPEGLLHHKLLPVARALYTMRRLFVLSHTLPA
jgi:hypothetical protein